MCAIFSHGLFEFYRAIESHFFSWSAFITSLQLLPLLVMVKTECPWHASVVLIFIEMNPVLGDIYASSGGERVSLIEVRSF